MRFDYIIVGAGSAGCILANRLSANGKYSVALMEAGGSDRNVLIRMPSAFSYPMNMKKYDWGYLSEPEPALDNRRIRCTRGRVLGGSSSINGMVFVRGHSRDFDEWASTGATGWTYADCLPYFKRLEDWMGSGNTYRGSHGPIGVSRGNDMRLNPLYRAFIDAGQQAGYPYTDDYNGEHQEGFSPMQMNVSNGVRNSTALCYLHPIKSRKNLSVFSNSSVTRLLFENNSCCGVEYITGTRRGKVKASREVILCAGAIGSPQLLQLSGIGEAELLRNQGIPVLSELPGVGHNLQDHLEVFFQYICKKPISLNRQLSLWKKAFIGLQWILFRTGLGSTNHFESCAFIRSSEFRQWPDIQYHFFPGAINYDGTTSFRGDGYQVHVGPNKPLSRGHVRIKSANWNDYPEILFNYLQHDQDITDWRSVIRLTRTIMEQPAFDEYRETELQPGLAIQDDQQIDDWVRQNVETAYHPCGTCKMGSKDDRSAVVNPDCQVYGLERLRVVDASVFPTIPNGNLNAPTMMVAEKAADRILSNSNNQPS
ncbi:MAG: choline dehydrogenase [Pseudomonadota bacterium]